MARWFLLATQIFSKLSIPRRNDNRHGALCLRLTRETNKWFRFSGVDIPELFDLFTFTGSDVRKFFCPAEHADPTRSAGSGATLDGNRSLDAARIDGFPVTGLIAGGAPREILALTESVSGATVILIPGYGPFMIDGTKETKQAWTIILRPLTQDLLRRLARVFPGDVYRTGGGLEGRDAGLLHSHESDGGDADQK